jgi:hypothetical protein
MSAGKLLGLATPYTEQEVLKAWRVLSKLHHPDKQDGDPVDDSMMKELNQAKDECLAGLERGVGGPATAHEDDEEFVEHICKVLNTKLQGIGLDAGADGVHFGNIIRPRLREFFRARTVDAMEWVLMCAALDREFEQAIDDEIPILCKFYNEYIGEGAWSNGDHTMMTVLNRYDRIKAGGYGNFARHLVQ